MTFVALITVFPVGYFMTQTLEDRFPAPKTISGQVDGIIVLGGTVRQLTTKFRGQVSLTGGAERLTEFIVLAKKYPNAKLAFSGGSGLLMHQDVKETETARRFFAQMGLDISRILFEDQSRNTYENAVYSYRLLAPKPHERWVLITSASHMARSVGVFRKAGWNLIPFPVDYATFGQSQINIGFNFVSGIKGFAGALREWSALLVYYLLDRTDTFFPAPDDV